MLTALDRLTIYSVLCFISFCALVLRDPSETSMLPLLGVAATILGIWIEMRKWSGTSKQEN
ncbi:hypothetical protein BS333_00105 [Vibrio azureus]|uniref:hypothetical protein n=1 Tax=Vibrio azureus TaxID=512649 RepID=UPI0003A88DBE|nr:hypothetical protein [Vibrio azureus]AUI84911.1 hypothetical protein BS333_00105 [Vibrio azureus]